MNEEFRDDFVWSAVQVGEKYFITMDYYLTSGAKPVLVGPFSNASEAWAEANRRSEESK